MKLICFPYAGGSSAIFNQWKNYIGSNIEIIAVELAGRGKRIHEAHYKDFDEVINDVFSLIIDEIKGNSDYAFFGHSMGAKIAFELTQEILKRGFSGPSHVFFSGRGAPYVLGKDEKEYHKLPDEEFKQEILKLGGTPKEFFDHPELLEVFLPMLKSDFKLAERDVIGKEINPLPFDITVFLGKDEELIPEQIDSWKKYTSENCTIHFFNGGHFFINDKVEEVVRKINNTIQLNNKVVNSY
jgi:surfactin synthase thioesterase subunit